MVSCSIYVKFLTLEDWGIFPTLINDPGISTQCCGKRYLDTQGRNRSDRGSPDPRIRNGVSARSAVLESSTDSRC